MPEFKRRERKHKKRSKEETGDTNPLELPARNGSRNEKLGAAHLETPGMSSKKKKRLDKYIENKLRKEEKSELLKKLAERKVDTSLLQSSKTLGRQTVSKREALSTALKHQRAGIGTAEDEKLLYQIRTPSVDRVVPHIVDFPKARAASAQRAATHEPGASVEFPQPEHVLGRVLTEASFGTGLKRPLQIDAAGQPIIKKRQRINKVAHVTVSAAVTPPWDGFSSDESMESSANDSDSMEDDSESLSEDEHSESSSRTGGSEEDDSDTSPSTGNYPLFAMTNHNTPAKARIKPRRQSDFKTWATQQINEAKEFTPSVTVTLDTNTSAERPKLNQLRPKEEDPLPPELQVTLEPLTRQIHSVHVARSEVIQESRSKLPIFAEEQKIMEAIHNNPVVLVCGATGSGKTTQVPQFLIEAGYGDTTGPTPGLIGITQPRRVAAVTMAKRVGEELCDPSKSSYQIRFDSTVGADTAVKFMTDGILLREISQDFALRKYSVIVIDEAHERSVNTDILIGMISRVVGLRNKLSQTDSSVKPLKLIIMSATLLKNSFLDNTKLFPNGIPPIVESEGRQYPVTMHFSRKTRQDYVEEAYQKVVKGHRKLPPGGMLVFLTGQNEINDLAKKLRLALSGSTSSNSATRVRINAKEAPLEADDLDLTEGLADGLEESDQDSGDEEEDKEFDIDNEEVVDMKVLILPLYSQLTSKEQLQVFDPPPDNTRLIVLATNVAETSITIPGIRYVFDSGRSKEKKYDKITGVQTFEIGWISKASASQRAGRAGRTGPGHCYRLYSSALYERDFADYTAPEILDTPIEGVVLQLKSLGLENVVNFPFPTPPDLESIGKAEKLLSYLGALDKDTRITELGRDLSLYPISPRLAKMVAIGHQFESIHYVVAMVAALAVPELFVPHSRVHRKPQTDEDQSDEEDDPNNTRAKAFNDAHATFSAHDPTSDAVKHTIALCSYMWSKSPDTFCSKWFLQPKAMKEAQRLYSQLLNVVSLNLPGTVNPKNHKLQPPNKTQVAALKQIVAAGFLDQVAIRADLAPTPPEMPRKPTTSTDVPYLTLFPTHTGRIDDVLSQVVFVHPSSLLAHTTSAKSMPQYLIYSHIQRGNTATIAGSKLPKKWMYPLTAVTGVQLASLARKTPLLEYGKPIGKIEIGADVNERTVWCVPSLVGERGGRVWPLPSVKTLQRRDKKGVWNVEKILK